MYISNLFNNISKVVFDAMEWAKIKKGLSSLFFL